MELSEVSTYLNREDLMVSEEKKKILEELVACGFDLDYEYVIADTNPEQLAVIQEALEHGQFTESLFYLMVFERASEEQMREVLLGQYSGVDIAVYDKGKWDWDLRTADDMRQERKRMEAMLPARPYYAEKLAREKFDALMHEINQDLFCYKRSIVNVWTGIIADPSHPDEYIQMRVEGYKTNNEVHMTAGYYKNGNEVYPDVSVQSIGTVQDGNVKKCLVETSMEFRRKLQSLVASLKVDTPKKYEGYLLYGTKFHNLDEWNKIFNVGRGLTAVRDDEQWCGNNTSLELESGKQYVITNYYLRDQIKVYGQPNEEEYIGIVSVEALEQALKEGTSLNKIEAVLPMAHCDYYFTCNGTRHALTQEPGSEKQPEKEPEKDPVKIAQRKKMKR